MQPGAARVAMNDPFRQFERSRAGLLIPLLLFLVGTVPTVVAMGAMISIRANQEVVVDDPSMDPSATDRVNEANSESSTILDEEMER